MNGVQTFDIRGGESLLGAAGNFIRFDSNSGKPIRIRGDGQDLGTLWPDESLTLPDAVTSWSIVADASESGVVRIGFGRIYGDVLTRRLPVLVMETDVAQVAAGAGPGWVSGTPAGLAAAGSTAVVFDLGPDWRQYTVAQVGVLPMGPSSGLSGVQAMGSDNTSSNPARRLKDLSVVGSANSSFSISTASNGHGFIVRPFGRFLIVTMTNADAANALGAASKVSVALYPA